MPAVRFLCIHNGHHDGVSQPWTDEIVRAADVVITMGCGDACPFYPCKRYEDWQLDDPAGRSIDDVRPIRDEIRRHVAALLSSLEVSEASITSDSRAQR